MPLINKEAMDSDSVSACPNKGNKQMRIKYFLMVNIDKFDQHVVASFLGTLKYQ